MRLKIQINEEMHHIGEYSGVVCARIVDGN
jgi:hypothetical protein